MGCVSLKSGQPSSATQYGKWDQLLRGTSHTGAHTAIVVDLWHCISECFRPAGIISAGRPPLFLLLPGPSGPLSLKAAVSSILLSKPSIQSFYPSCKSLPWSTFMYHIIMWRQLSSHKFMRRINLSSLQSFHFHFYCLMNPLIHSPHLSTLNIHGGD